MTALPPISYTTKIDAGKTAAEIQSLLAKHGCQRIAIDYQDGRPSGLLFAMDTVHGMRMYDLPVDVEAMHALLKRTRPRGLQQSPEQAERVAWRVVLYWLQAQLTLIASQMVKLEEVMLPYMRVDEHRTLREAYADLDGHLMLEAAR